MASSMSNANAVTIFQSYWNILMNPSCSHDINELTRTQALLANIFAMLTTTNTDGGYTIALAEPRVTITPFSNGVRPYKVKSGSAISYSFASTGGENTNQAVAWSASGLPNWLALNAGTGALTGTAPVIGPSTGLMPVQTALVSAINGFGQAVNGPAPFIFEVTNALAPNVTSAGTGGGVHAGALTTYTVTADNTPSSFIAYDLDKLNVGAVPGTVAINSATGAITGNLGSGAGSLAAGPYTIYVCAANANGEGVDKAVVITLT